VENLHDVSKNVNGTVTNSYETDAYKVVIHGKIDNTVDECAGNSRLELFFVGIFSYLILM